MLLKSVDDSTVTFGVFTVAVVVILLWFAVPLVIIAVGFVAVTFEFNV